MLQLQTSSVAVDSALLERSVDEHHGAKHPPADHEGSNVNGVFFFCCCVPPRRMRCGCARQIPLQADEDQVRQTNPSG